MGEGELKIELIDKDKAINALIPIMCEHSLEEDVQGEIILSLLNVPTVEAKPVVHCKDCTMLQYCKFGQYLGLEGYCSRGEKHD